MATIVQLAGMLPRDPQFRAWASEFISGARSVHFGGDSLTKRVISLRLKGD